MESDVLMVTDLNDFHGLTQIRIWCSLRSLANTRATSRCLQDAMFCEVRAAAVGRAVVRMQTAFCDQEREGHPSLKLAERVRRIAGGAWTKCSLVDGVAALTRGWIISGD